MSSGGSDDGCGGGCGGVVFWVMWGKVKGSEQVRKVRYKWMSA